MIELFYLACVIVAIIGLAVCFAQVIIHLDIRAEQRFRERYWERRKAEEAKAADEYKRRCEYHRIMGERFGQPMTPEERKKYP